MPKFVGLEAKAYRCLIDDSSEDKKAYLTKTCVRKIGSYKNCLEATELENKNELFRKK